MVKTGRHFKRWLGFVYCDSKFLQHELLKLGLAWHAVTYSKSEEMQALHDEAKAKRVGLWSESNPIDPDDWRDGVR